MTLPCRVSGRARIGERTAGDVEGYEIVPPVFVSPRGCNQPRGRANGAYQMHFTRAAHAGHFWPPNAFGKFTGERAPPPDAPLIDTCCPGCIFRIA